MSFVFNSASKYSGKSFLKINNYLKRILLFMISFFLLWLHKILIILRLMLYNYPKRDPYFLITFYQYCISYLKLKLLSLLKLLDFMQTYYSFAISKFYCYVNSSKILFFLVKNVYFSFFIFYFHNQLSYLYLWKMIFVFECLKILLLIKL